MCELHILGNYVEQDDNSLLNLYRSGDSVACTALIAKYAVVINKRISGYSIRGVDSDDLKQEAYMGLFSAIRSFHDDKNTSFYTYANHCIGNRLKNMFVSVSTKKAVSFQKSVSFDEIEDENISDKNSQNPELLFIQNESYKNLMDLMEQHLSQREKDVLFLYLSGCNYSTISAELSSSQKSVDNALQRARKKLKVVLNNL